MLKPSGCLPTARIPRTGSRPREVWGEVSGTFISSGKAARQYKWVPDEDVAAILPIWIKGLASHGSWKVDDGLRGRRIEATVPDAVDRSQGGEAASAMSVCGHRHD